MSAAQGGSCKSGALAGGFSAAAGPVVAGLTEGNFYGGLAGRMAAGCVGSYIGKGACEAGAVTAAFDYIYNECGASFMCRGQGYSGSASDQREDGMRPASDADDQRAMNRGLAVAGAVPMLRGVVTGVGLIRALMRDAEIEGTMLAERDILAASLQPMGGRAPATVTAGRDAAGNVVAKACAGGKCAENHVADALPGTVTKFTTATRPRSGREVPICSNCQALYGRDHFPSGAQFGPK